MSPAGVLYDKVHIKEAHIFLLMHMYTHTQLRKGFLLCKMPSRLKKKKAQGDP